LSYTTPPSPVAINSASERISRVLMSRVTATRRSSRSSSPCRRAHRRAIRKRWIDWRAAARAWPTVALLGPSYSTL
jgi:hypothetical protein